MCAFSVVVESARADVRVSFVVALLEFVGTYVMFETSIKGSRRLFEQFLATLCRLPLSFFEQTPMGRILSRCSNDFDMIDDDMMFTLRSTLNALLGFSFSVLLIAYYLPETIAVTIVLLVPFFLLEVKTNAHELLSSL